MAKKFDFRSDAILNSNHWCEKCRTWIQPDPISIRNHENGKNHQFNVKRFLFEQRSKKAESSRAEQDLARTLARVNDAAQAQFAMDRAAGIPPPPPHAPPPPPRGFAGIYFGHMVVTVAGNAITGATTEATAAVVAVETITAAGTAPPPSLPPPRPSRWSAAAPVSAASGDSNSNLIPLPPPPPPPPPPTDDDTDDAERGPPAIDEPQVLGLYSVRGIAYLQAEFHGALLHVGTQCEAFMEDDDDWAPVVITAIREQAVPNTTLVLRFYSVARDLPSATSSSSSSSTFSSLDAVPAPPPGEGVHTKRDCVELPATSIRMIATEDLLATLRGIEADADASPAEPPPPVIDENTGLGAWQFVATTTEDPLAVAAAATEAEAATSLTGSKKRGRRELDARGDVSKELTAFSGVSSSREAESDSAFTEHNPFGGLYKGVDVEGGSSAPAFDAAATAAGCSVGDNSGGGEALGGAAAAGTQFKKRELKPGHKLRKRLPDD